MKSLKNLNFEKIQNVGVRVDFNVPVDKNSKITDKTRIERSKETINYLKNKKCNIFLISHFGRPKKNYDEKYSFIKLIKQFEVILEFKLNFISYDSFLENGLKQNFNNLNYKDFISASNINAISIIKICEIVFTESIR